MKWYPWLNDPYRKILAHYRKAHSDCALLLHSRPGNGEASLCYALSRWLICQNREGTKSCRFCRSCRLMIAGNHPDFYQPKPEHGRESLGVESIRAMIHEIYGRTPQGGVKVVCLPHVEQLTEQAAAALLKTLEEPPKGTYFLIGCQTPARLLPTLRSRCLYWPLPTPSDTLGLNWLRKAGYSDPISAHTALRLSSNAPLAAANLLQPSRWQARLALCSALKDALASNDFLVLLPTLNQDQDDAPVHWLLSLLTDALRWQQGADRFLINTDRTSLVIALGGRCSSSVLHVQWQGWLQYFRQCQEIRGVNRELLLTHYLLSWEKNMNNYSTSLLGIS
ncbi:DNA polymerase III subunit delta' C-terminal domain-containing protein [secondary endosymbiont of Ctenarytaina eucalypti]|uniref:DNA polymerase III subunit delta' n=1 Tax=secondary endosymbiont of Ctenarytaina eucalypti TaxID=1199245 RepID=J3TY02_9ENTR|nr:DNA polymerase III subunit delta' C-terminal domain-containing protein [secondary endosymbiont of Ctenarytaina eucalypti]AFP85190.1 DNA polymerase III, gamma/tau subunit [secondary endosymbiont of Ctenarytaina eucalypti]